jgi:hypothetical protein
MTQPTTTTQQPGHWRSSVSAPPAPSCSLSAMRAHVSTPNLSPRQESLSAIHSVIVAGLVLSLHHTRRLYPGLRARRILLPHRSDEAPPNLGTEQFVAAHSAQSTAPATALLLPTHSLPRFYLPRPPPPLGSQASILAPAPLLLVIKVIVLPPSVHTPFFARLTLLCQHHVHLTNLLFVSTYI